MLTAAKYSITVLMFNHVISGIETVWSSQKKAIRKKDERAMLDSNINLVYDPESPPDPVLAWDNSPAKSAASPNIPIVT